MDADPLNIMSTRCAGILLHPTSLPNGILDHEVFRWLDFIEEAGLSVWQTLPLGVPQAGLSPYQCDSAFAINPLFEDTTNPIAIDVAEYDEWKMNQQFWLHDYALFATLKKQFEQKPWFEWPDNFCRRDEETLQSFSRRNRTEIETIKEQQFRLHMFWKSIRRYAHEKKISLFGDIPIFVAHDSADVWSRPFDFLLDDQGLPTVIAGVPPDYFSETGQRWGNPHYHWENHEKSGFKWWLERLKSHFDFFDTVRIDHFRGLDAVWTIDKACKTAIEGYWQKVPGAALLQLLSSEYDPLPLVAEDLGVITPEVTALRDQFNLPGMAVLQFAFDHFEDNPHKPQNINSHTVVYTGTHDNDTTPGWFQALNHDQQQHVMNIIGTNDPESVTDTIINLALGTQANLAVVPLQDFLGLGSVARMNTPGTVEDNWSWRYTPDQLNQELAHRIHQKLKTNGRLV